MSFFEQMKQQMQEQFNKQQQASYLLPSDLNTVVEFLIEMYKERIDPRVCKKLSQLAEEL